MSKNDAEVYIENQRLKRAFEQLNLPLDDVFSFVPYNLEIENRRLANLLDFTQQYLKHRSRKVMELSNQPFAPVFPSISPENDWLRFEKWINGEPTIQKIKDRLPKDYAIIPSSDLTDEALEVELRKIEKLLAETGYFIGLQKDIPLRLSYQMILDSLDDEDMMGEGWHNDGCDGYCPGCQQRPWCDTGQDLCWTEDEEAGKMAFPEELDEFVSASPISLFLLQETQRLEDEKMEAFKKEQKDKSDNEDTFEFPDLGDELFDISSN